ncbi:hypothetical protein [Acetobacter thailandicus]|uniref:hypothetical protein n=1 Tax=Acetobacter thailandicus TaxID=1502842 RepID=UPI001BAD1861|nr:hypothetical protein [Acetobacter thailandicus]MBS0986034.1 hypothetical protein [Acetobacter thailandicus]
MASFFLMIPTTKARDLISSILIVLCVLHTAGADAVFWLIKYLLSPVKQSGNSESFL